MRYLLTILLLLGLAATAQTDRKVPVGVLHGGQDPVGKRLVEDIKRAVGVSQAMRYVGDGKADPRVMLLITTAEGVETMPGISTAMGLSIAYQASNIPMHGILISGFTKTCGAQRTESCARDAVAIVDSALEDMRRNNPEYWASLVKK